MSRRSGHTRRQASVDIPKYPPQSLSNTQTQAQSNAPHNLPPPLVSDYESDNLGYVSDYVPTQQPPSRTPAELNISVVRRYNPDIVQVMSVAPYAVIYEFTPLPEPEWTKIGIEGSMFLCQLTPGVYNEDRYNVLVLNRRDRNNFEVELREAEDGGVEFNEPYVIISCREKHELKIYGVFIFSEGPGTSTERTREYNAELMMALAKASGASRSAAEMAASQATEQHTRGHMQEAEATAPDVDGRPISLQQLFGRQRDEDAAFSTVTHSEQNGTSQHRPDVLGDLFKRSGLT